MSAARVPSSPTSSTPGATHTLHCTVTIPNTNVAIQTSRVFTTSTGVSSSHLRQYRRAARFESPNHHQHTNSTNLTDQQPALAPHRPSLLDVCRRLLDFSSKHVCSSSSWQQPIRGQILSRHCQASSNQTARPPGSRGGHEFSSARARSLMRRAGRL